VKSKATFFWLLPLLCVIFVCSNTLIGNASVSSVEVTPGDPVQGDTLSILVKASPGEEIDVSISFDHTLSVSGSSFSWVITGIEIPLLLNSFTITAENTETLRATFEIEGILITFYSEGIDGLATLSHSIDEAGSYWVEISGVAVSGAASIPLTITVTSTIETDQVGTFVYYLNTREIPVGDITALIGDVTKVTHISPRPTPPPSNHKPVAVSDHPNTGIVGEQVLFDASGSYDLDNDIAEYSWSFGDGSTNTGETVSHMYTEPGKYSVTLSVMDAYRTTGSTGSEIEIKNNELPVAYAGPDRTVYEYSLILLDASESFDPDGEIMEYLWYVNGTIYTGVTTSWTPDIPGKYVVYLTVTDEYNGTNVDESVILVQDEIQPPEIKIHSVSAPESVATGETFIVQGTVDNTGGTGYSFEINLQQNGVPIDYQILDTSSGETMEIVFSVTVFEKGIYNYSLGNQTVSVHVKKTQPSLYIAFINLPDSFSPKNVCNLTYIIKNDGNATLTEGIVTFFIDDDPQQEIILYDVYPGELIILDYIWTPQRVGKHILMIKVDTVHDDINGKSIVQQVMVMQNYTRIAVSIFVIFIVFIGWRYMRASQQR